MKPPPDGVWIKLPLSPATIAKASAHAERIARVVETAPEFVKLGASLWDACAEVLTALEKDVNKLAGKKRRRPRARRIR
jgi:hypothetical protein